MSIKMETERQLTFQSVQKSQNILRSNQSSLFMHSEWAQDTKFYYHLSTNINLLSQMKVSKNAVVLRAIFLRNNGNLVKIPAAYAQFFQKSMKSAQKNIEFHYSRSQERIKVKITSLKKMDTEYPTHNFIQITNAIESCIKHLKNVLCKIGIIKQYNGSSLKTKKAQLILQQKIRKILLQRSLNSQEKQTKIIEHTKNGLLKQCLLMKEIPDPPEHLMNPENIPESTNTDNFKIQRKLFEIVELNNKGSQIKELAVKKVNNLTKNKDMLQTKVLDEKNIISKIPISQYFLNYWAQISQNPEEIHMDFVSNTLSDLIYFRSNSISDILDYSDQLIRGVSILHQYGVIHRDLKPHNILAEEKTSQSEYRLKIIDFGQSTHVSNSEKQSTTAMGYTLPYSPFQCAYPGYKGLFAKQIDYWSVGLLIYEIMFRHNPIQFHHPFAQNLSKITKGIKMKDDFEVISIHKKCQGLRMVEFILNILTLHSVCIDPQERINLQQMKEIILSSQQFIKNISDF